jgi:hypothetical protein
MQHNNMTNKELYHDLCQTNNDIPLFMQDWWMEAVCAGKQWDVLLYTQQGTDTIIAAMPYLLRKRAHASYIIMPQQTQIGGIWISKHIQTDHQLVGTICQTFVEQLQQLDLSYYYQHYPIQSVAVRHMQTLGFKIKERVTYRIEDLTDLDAVVNAFSKNKKRQLQKAQSLRVDMHMNVEEFYRFHTRCLQEQEKTITYTREFFLVLERKTHRLGQSQLIAIRNTDNELLAAAFLVWDTHSMYYLIPCYSPKHKDSGAGALLVLEALKLAHELGLAFDFEGSMIPGVANHYQQFGSTPTVYCSVEKYYKWWFWLAMQINHWRERHQR